MNSGIGSIDQSEMVKLVQKRARLVQWLRPADPPPVRELRADGDGGIHLVLDPPPSTNNLYRTVLLRTRDGRFVPRRRLDLKARRYKCGVAAAIIDWLIDGGAIARRKNTRYAFELLVIGDRRRDLDNCAKIVLDAVCLGLGIDDARVDSVRITRQAAPNAEYRAEARLVPCGQRGSPTA
jgi:hypothetical protein